VTQKKIELSHLTKKAVTMQLLLIILQENLEIESNHPLADHSPLTIAGAYIKLLLSFLFYFIFILSHESYGGAVLKQICTHI